MSKTVIGIIGCGNISDAYFKGAQRSALVEVKACADLHMEAARAKAALYGTTAKSVDELLADPDITLVVNLTVPVAHAAVSQLKTLSLKNTGMCVTTDIATVGDIHPPNKQDVGRRLALWALANTYEKTSLPFSGPLYDSMAVEGNKVRIKFKHGGGLHARGNKGLLTHFTVAGEDQKFVDAKATVDGETVVVESDQVAKPVAVRFAWNELAEPNLFNGARLPASPFRTDDFPLLTTDAK